MQLSLKDHLEWINSAEDFEGWVKSILAKSPKETEPGVLDPLQAAPKDRH